jgi:hypothetical protein
MARRPRSPRHASRGLPPTLVASDQQRKRRGLNARRTMGTPRPCRPHRQSFPTPTPRFRRSAVCSPHHHFRWRRHRHPACPSTLVLSADWQLVWRAAGVRGGALGRVVVHVAAEPSLFQRVSLPRGWRAGGVVHLAAQHSLCERVSLPGDRTGPAVARALPPPAVARALSGPAVVRALSGPAVARVLPAPGRPPQRRARGDARSPERSALAAASEPAIPDRRGGRRAGAGPAG